MSSKWLTEYRSKVVSEEEAVSGIKNHDRIFTSGNAATPYKVLEALARRKDELQGVEVYHLLLMGDEPLSRPEMAGHFRHKSLFVGRRTDWLSTRGGRTTFQSFSITFRGSSRNKLCLTRP
jgi:acyl-CoA hydrolase